MCGEIHYVEAEGLVHVRLLCQSRDRATVVSETIIRSLLVVEFAILQESLCDCNRLCYWLLGVADCVLGC